MNFKKLIAAVSTVAMLGSLATALSASAGFDESLSAESVDTYTFKDSDKSDANDVVLTTGTNENTGVITCIWKFTVPQPEGENNIFDTTMRPETVLSDTKYKIESYTHLGNNVTGSSNGLYAKILGASGWNLIGQSSVKTAGYNKKTANDIAFSSDTKIQIKNRDFPVDTVNYLGMVFTPTAYKVTANEGCTIVSGVGEDGYAVKNTTVTYTDSTGTREITVTEPTVLKDKCAVAGEIAYDTLSAAYSSNNAVVDLKKDVTENGDWKIGTIQDKSRTLNGNGHTLTTNGRFLVNTDISDEKITFNDITINSSKDTFTMEVIRNSQFTINNNATVINSGNAPAVVLHASGGSNTLNLNGTVKTNGAYVIKVNNGKLVLGESAKLQSTDSTKTVSIQYAGGNIDASAYKGEILNITLDSTNAETLVGKVIAKGTPEQFNIINEGYALKAVEGGLEVVKETKHPEYFTFESDTTSGTTTYNKVTATAQQGEGADAKTDTKTVNISTITLDNAGAIYLQIVSVPENVKITSITLE